MGLVERIWTRNHPGEPLPIEYMPRVTAILPRDVEGEVRVMAVQEFAHKPKPARTVEVVYGELNVNTEALERTVTLGRDLVKNDGLLRAELAELIAAGKAESQANIKALEDLEQRAGVGVKETKQCSPATTSPTTSPIITAPAIEGATATGGEMTADGLTAASRLAGAGVLVPTGIPLTQEIGTN